MAEALNARKLLVSSRRQSLFVRSTNLDLKKSLLSKMVAAVDMESEILEKQRSVLKGEEELFEMIESTGLGKDFTLSDAEEEEEEEGSAARPPQSKRSRTDRYGDIAKAQEEFLAGIEARDGIRAQLSAAESRIIALTAERRAAEEESVREKALLWEFACTYMSPIRKLPVEMVRKIFSYLPPLDLVSAGQVCSAWRAIFKERSLWKDMRVISEYDFSKKQFQRLVKAAPQLGTVHSGAYREWPAPIRPLQIDLLILEIHKRSTGAPSVLKHYGEWIRQLRLPIYYKHTAQVIDTKVASLEELSVNFKCQKPYIFNGRFVRRSTLVTLRCWDAPAGTLASILGGHSATLQRVCLRASSEARPLPGSAINAALENCPRLRTLEVECRTVGLQVPARCSELVLVVGGCPPPPQGCPGCQWLGLTSLTRLHLVTRTTPAAPQEDSARPLSWLLGHVRQLDPRFLRALGQLSLRCPCRREQHPEHFAQLERLTRDCGSVRIGGVTEEDEIFTTFSTVDGRDW